MPQMCFFLSEMKFWDFQREKEGKKRVKFQYFLKLPTDSDFLHHKNSRKHSNGNFHVQKPLRASNVYAGVPNRGLRGGAYTTLPRTGQYVYESFGAMESTDGSGIS